MFYIIYIYFKLNEIIVIFGISYKKDKEIVLGWDHIYKNNKINTKFMHANELSMDNNNI